MKRRRSVQVGPCDLLLGARYLLQGPGAWCRGTFARDLYGREVDAVSPLARAWCLEGAVARAAWQNRADPAVWEAALALLRREVGAVGPWNDQEGRTQAEVLALLDRILARCGQEAPR